MKNKINIRMLPAFLFLVGLTVVLYLFFFNSINDRISLNSRASSARNLTIVGKIEKLPECLDSFICYDIVENNSGLYYHLYSKRFPKLFRKDLCLGKENCPEKTYANIGLEDYVNSKVTISGFLVEGKISYLIITDLNIDPE
jgi:hypothetical protein